MPVDSNAVANEAIMMMGGSQPPVSGNTPNFDDSAAGKALKYLYTPCVRSVGREFGWDFARNIVTLALSGNAPPLGYAFEYVYPNLGVQVWQLVPSTFDDANNPAPINWTVGNAIVSAAQTKVIWSSLVNAKAVYNNAPTESTWDDGFREAMVRKLASELAMAIAGKPDAVQVLLQTAGAMDQIAQKRDS